MAQTFFFFFLAVLFTERSTDGWSRHKYWSTNQWLRVCLHPVVCHCGSGHEAPVCASTSTKTEIHQTEPCGLTAGEFSMWPLVHEKQLKASCWTHSPLTGYSFTLTAAVWSILEQNIQTVLNLSVADDSLRRDVQRCELCAECELLGGAESSFTKQMVQSCLVLQWKMMCQFD